MPNIRQSRNNLDLVVVLNKFSPHIVKEEKRVLVRQSLTFAKRLSLPKNYPFKNGKQANTKGSIVWTDYSINTWPLLLHLLKTCSHPFEKVLNDYFNENNNLMPNWLAVKQHLISNGSPTKNIDMDELDKWYDEINATLLKPQAYHELYRWFGNDIRDVGYQAFDFFMEERNTFSAWQRAISGHLNTITNLPEEHRDYLLSKHFNNLIKP